MAFWITKTSMWKLFLWTGLKGIFLYMTLFVLFFWHTNQYLNIQSHGQHGKILFAMSKEYPENGYFSYLAVVKKIDKVFRLVTWYITLFLDLFLVFWFWFVFWATTIFQRNFDPWSRKWSQYTNILYLIPNLSAVIWFPILLIPI